MSQLSTRAARKGRPTRAARLRGAASVLAFVAAGVGLSLAGAAQAGCTGSAVTITSSSPLPATDAAAQQLDGPNCPSSVTVASGTAIVIPNWGYLGTLENRGWVPLVNNGGALSTNPSGAVQGGSAQAGQLIVNEGATLVFGGQQSVYGSPYQVYDNMLNAAGNVVFEGNGGYAGNNQTGLTGVNTITGNVTLEAGANVRIGEYYTASTVNGQPNPALSNAPGKYAAANGSYGASTINFGPNTNVSLQGASGAGNDAVLYLNLNSQATIGGALSATAYSEVWLHSGTLAVNGGANVAADSFDGVLQLDPGTTFIVGADAAHSSAVFGATDGTSLTLDIQRPQGGSPATLKGYGTIYANVTNEGIVQPGGVAGAPGTLTINGNYTQSSSGILKIEVTPHGASELKVVGNASLAGTLALAIDPGNYGNAVMPVVSTGGKLTIDPNLSITTQGNSAAGLAETSNSIDVVTELTSSLEVFGHLVSADRTHINAFADSLYDAQTGALGGSAEASSKSQYGNGTSAWIQPYGQTSTISHAGYGYDSNIAGVTGGIEHRLPLYNALVGFAGSYGGGTLTTDSGQTSATTNTWDAAVYGGFDMPNARIEGMVFYNGYDANVSRRLGSAGTIDSSPKATAYGASLQISHGIDNNVVVPYMRFTFADIDQTALTESGANLLALKVNHVQEGFFTGEAGLKIHPDAAIKLPWGFHSEITLAAVHDFSQTPGENVSGQFANLKSSQFNFAWTGDQGTAGLVGLNLASDVTSHVQVFGKVDGEFSTYGRAGELRLGANYRF